MTDFEITKMILDHIEPRLFTHNGWSVGVYGVVTAEFGGHRYGFFKAVEVSNLNPYLPDNVKAFHYGFELLEYLANHNPAIAAVLASPEVKNVFPTDD